MLTLHDAGATLDAIELTGVDIGPDSRARTQAERQAQRQGARVRRSGRIERQLIMPAAGADGEERPAATLAAAIDSLELACTNTLALAGKSKR